MLPINQQQNALYGDNSGQYAKQMAAMASGPQTKFSGGGAGTKFY